MMLSARHQAAGNPMPIVRKSLEGNETGKRWTVWSSATKPRPAAAGYSKKTGNRDPGRIAALLSRPYLEQVTRNCKDESDAYRALIAMAVGLDDCKEQVQQAMGIRHQKPQKAQLREEAKRRYIVLGLETTNYRPYKPNKSWKAPHILKWLEEHPITAPDCIRFVKSELAAAGTVTPLDNKTFLEGRQKLFDNMSRIMSTKDEHNAADFFKVMGNLAAAAADVTMADPSSASDGSPFSSSMIKSQGTLTSQQLSLMNMTNLSPSESELCSSRWSETTNAAEAMSLSHPPPMETATILEVTNRKLHDASGKRGLYTGQCLVHHSHNGERTLEPHQKGKMKYRNGRVVYDGEWKNGQRHGRGRLEEYDETHQPAASSSTMTRNSSQQQQQQDRQQLLIYEGEWKQNKRDGEGAQRYANGVWLHSNWTKDRPVGEGHYVFCGGNNNIQVAAIDGKSCNHARHVWDDGSWYEGEWKYGWQHGNGTKYYASGVTLSSQWVKDYPVGEGVYTFANHVRRSCEDGRVQEARHVFADGSVYEGAWFNGIPIPC